MPTWGTRGLRGSFLEEHINFTIDRLRESRLALIQKIPTPITPMEIDKETRHITLAFFDKKSTVDYLGAVQGIPVCFDAKECAGDTFPLSNIHEHQVRFMREMEEQDGVSFLLLYFSHRQVYYYLRMKELERFLGRMANGGRRSFTVEELTPGYFLRERNQMIPFLDALQRDLEERD